MRRAADNMRQQLRYSRAFPAFQVGYKGYCGTLGADYISYMLTDAVVSPPDYAVHFAEKLMYMPLSHYINNYR
jgi:protein O-GlcNAc transferase